MNKLLLSAAIVLLHTACAAPAGPAARSPAPDSASSQTAAALGYHGPPQRPYAVYGH